MDEILRLTFLYDFYGELLTEKQKLVFEMHYQNDLSLSEIGEELSISRQAVRDQLKRTEKILIGYEEKLRLVERFQQQQRAVLKMKNILDEIGTGEVSRETTEAIVTMKQIADAILS
ncbi:YlxM family DNA-binding protein [Anaerotignum propionicum]|uniref:UPF0122 protein CPRO_20390 n=2 Tax=root TaxID=1 RepID=A0A0X8VD68_ANAPI|nr:YlxM family DNA-binding protein [Anaerotignum propionicum]AMJ41620.1 putative DNA-binding protein [Anaerotignum propionicum DSM 1682]MEA5057309.1 YlxM family DNA-binding protein [Anaerotignum propionicum]SHE87516.1 hypothetical protein SAMN02745151_02060 [[Clostridium] propionicum DSM 1682] [Anaerotignum propionicum DSM 1682]